MVVKPGPNSDGDVRNIDGWSGQREREREKWCRMDRKSSCRDVDS